MFSGTMSVLALLFSIASFAYVNYDRRVKLLLRPRRGAWCVLDRATNGRETIFQGIIEVYNHSSRPNAVRSYRFWTDSNGVHEDLESEMVSIGERSDPRIPVEKEYKELFNVTPLPIPALHRCRSPYLCHRARRPHASGESFADHGRGRGHSREAVYGGSEGIAD